MTEEDLALHSFFEDKIGDKFECILLRVDCNIQRTTKMGIRCRTLLTATSSNKQQQAKHAITLTKHSLLQQQPATSCNKLSQVKHANKLQQPATQVKHAIALTNNEKWASGASV